MEFLVACGGYDRRDMDDESRWKDPLGQVQRVPRAHGDTKEEKSTTRSERSDITHDSLYVEIYEGERTGLEICAYESER